MSVQIAMMAGMAAMSAASAIQQGNAQGAAAEGQAGSSRVQGAQLQVQAAQTRLQAQQEELQRRNGLARLLSANRAGYAGSGFSGEQGSSFDVTQDYNTDQANKDIANIRFMGESRAKMLDFGADAKSQDAARYMGMASMARTSGIFNAVRSIGMAGYSLMGGFGKGSPATPNSPMDGSYVSTT